MTTNLSVGIASALSHQRIPERCFAWPTKRARRRPTEKWRHALRRAQRRLPTREGHLRGASGLARPTLKKIISTRWSRPLLRIVSLPWQAEKCELIRQRLVHKLPKGVQVFGCRSRRKVFAREPTLRRWHSYHIYLFAGDLKTNRPPSVLVHVGIRTGYRPIYVADTVWIACFRRVEYPTEGLIGIVKYTRLTIFLLRTRNCTCVVLRDQYDRTDVWQVPVANHTAALTRTFNRCSIDRQFSVERWVYAAPPYRYRRMGHCRCFCTRRFVFRVVSKKSDSQQDCDLAERFVTRLPYTHERQAMLRFKCLAIRWTCWI